MNFYALLYILTRPENKSPVGKAACLYVIALNTYKTRKQVASRQSIYSIVLHKVGWLHGKVTFYVLLYILTRPENKSPVGKAAYF